MLYNIINHMEGEMSKLALEIAHMIDAVAIGSGHNMEDMEDLVRVAKKYDLHLD